MNLLIPEVTIEECAEVIQSITKIMRFGMLNNGYDNKSRLEEEIGQLNYMLWRLSEEWELNETNIVNGFNEKEEALEHYANHNVCNQTQPEPSAKS